MKKLITGLLISLLFVFGFNLVNAQSGCCSWHGGVSHCDSSTGRQVCNDGTYSPSCTCQQPIDAPTYFTIINSINKCDYFKNPDGFREIKISELMSILPCSNQEIMGMPCYNQDTIAYWVYKLLPDVQCRVNMFNCTDFDIQECAQAVYDKCMQEVGKDVHYLDADSDGQACEANK